MATATQADLDALESAIRRGIRSVEYNGESVTYRSLDEMRAILKEMKRQISSSSSTGASYPTFSKGL